MIISLEHVGAVRFFTEENDDASANALCRFIVRQKSRAKKQRATAAQDHPSIREIIREKEVIIKVRCRYCRNTFDETLDRCPHYGGRA